MNDRSAASNSAQADHWVARMDAVSWSAADESELKAWLAADPRRHGALLQAQAAWMTLDPHLAGALAPDSPRRTMTRRSLMIGGGGLLAASLAAGFAWLSSGDTYRTMIGEIRRVPLADGSTVTINTASEIEVTLARDRREIRLASGEAWFQVAKDPRRPFVVQTGVVLVRAVGTAFSVRRLAEGANLLVSEGIVEAWATDAEGHKVRVSAGQRAFIGDNGQIRLEPTSRAAIARALAWRTGSIALSGMTLGDAVADFNRYNRRKLMLADPHLASERFDGVFRADDPAGFAAAIGASLHVPIDRSEADMIRIGNPT
jgi:transmembrane sensor